MSIDRTQNTAAPPTDADGELSVTENSETIDEKSEPETEADEKPDGNGDGKKSDGDEKDGQTDGDGEKPAADGSETEAEAEAPPKKKRIWRILGNVFLVAVIALGIWSLFGVVREIDPGAISSLDDVLRGASPVFCVVLVLIVLLAMALDVFKFCIVSKTVTGKFHVATSAKTNFIGKYYDAVTPFAAGGQPMQIYYLNTKGVSGGNSSAIVLIRYIFSILSWIILGGVLMIVGTVQGVLDGVSGGNLLRITGWIGIAINLIIPTFVLLFLVVPKFMTKLTTGIVKLGYKMKIVKDVDKTTARATKVVTDFKSAFKLMATSPVKFIILLLTCFAESAITFSVPYFVMKAFACPVDGMLISVMSLNVFATFGVSFVPTPGNSGVMESMGALAFSAAAGSALIWSVLTWRLFVFYIYIVIGLIITVFDIIKKNMRKKRT